MIRAVLVASALARAAPSIAPAALLEPADAGELAQTLADATEAQDVCYGWYADVDGAPETGSSFGPDVDVLSRPCERWVRLVATIDYVPEYAEGEDSARVDVSSSFPNGPTARDLADLGLTSAGLLGENDDVTLMGMVEALPLLTADRAGVPYVPAPETTTPVPAQDVPTGAPATSDWLRTRWELLVACAGAIVLGGLLVVRGLAARTLRRPLAPPRETEG